jgi:uncharacterized protein
MKPKEVLLLQLLERSPDNEIAPPFLDLFDRLRGEGMQLTWDHYDWLQKALLTGHGLESWGSLKRTCQVLWVKPSNNYDREIFDREFDLYCQQFQQEPNQPEHPSPITPYPLVPSEAEVLPQVPPRLMPTRAKSPIKAPTGVKTSPSDLHLSGKNNILKPIDLPISIPKMREYWRVLRRVSRTGIKDEIDVERTVDRIMELGFLDDIILRSPLKDRSELIVLVDDGDGTLPYFPALAPLFKAIEGNWITPARVYRFTTYPAQLLYDWHKPLESVVVERLISQLHQHRSIVLVISDAGAASRLHNDDRLAGTLRFLDRWDRCVSQILWINPVPQDRWEGTPAAEIYRRLGGGMVSLDDWGSRE